MLFCGCSLSSFFAGESFGFLFLSKVGKKLSVSRRLLSVPCSFCFGRPIRPNVINKFDKHFFMQLSLIFFHLFKGKLPSNCNLLLGLELFVSFGGNNKFPTVYTIGCTLHCTNDTEFCALSEHIIISNATNLDSINPANSG